MSMCIGVDLAKTAVELDDSIWQAHKWFDSQLSLLARTWLV
jgi:hypothetical protein